MAKKQPTPYIQKVVIEGKPWEFVVYHPDDAYTLIDPSGKHIPPAAHMDRDEIEAIRASARQQQKGTK
jgi:hypothetical protein